jgi:hypothetical protein
LQVLSLKSIRETASGFSSHFRILSPFPDFHAISGSGFRLSDVQHPGANPGRGSPKTPVPSTGLASPKWDFFFVFMYVANHVQIDSSMIM